VDTRTIQRDLAFLRRHERLAIIFDRELRGYRCDRPKPRDMRETRAKKWGRLMDLIHRIAAEPGRSSQELATAMRCTQRTIFRDLSELQDLGLALYNDDGYRFAADAFLPAINLEPRELLALLLGARLLESIGGEDLAPEARRALEKLLRATSEERRPDMGALRNTVQMNAPSEDTGVSQLMRLQAVIGNGAQLRLRYLGLHDQQALDRVVDPMGLFGFRQVWYLRAFDHGRGGFRSFRLSRVVDWEQLETPVVHSAKMELQEAVYHRWDIEGAEVLTVELKVTEPLARWLVENPPHPSQQVEGDRVVYQVSDLAAVARWAASLHGLEVISPAPLRRQMAGLAGELQALYGGA
jgi:predicted DNA-binding transcriptional regulator YafY